MKDILGIKRKLSERKKALKNLVFGKLSEKSSRIDENYPHNKPFKN